MISFHEIKSIDDNWYHNFRNIYIHSFPEHEQRNTEQQVTAFSHPCYHLFFTQHEGKMLSFISFWDFKDYMYIEHLAVNEEFRGKNIGSQTLSAFKDETKKTLILEIDPVVNELTRKRLSFYEKLNFKVNPYAHFHPPYDPAYSPHELLVLSSDAPVSVQAYTIFKNDLEHIVMKG